MSAQKQRCVACGQPIPSGGQCCSGACANFVAGVFDASDLGRPCMKDKDAREDLEIAKSEFITFDEYFGPNPKKKMSAKKIEALKKMDGEMKGRIRVLLGDAEFDLDGEIKKYCVELAANTLVECKSNLLARQAVGEILSAQANLLLKGIGPKRVGGTDLNLENKTVECMLWTGESRKKSDLVDVIVFISPSDESPGEQKKSEAIPKAKVR